MTARRPSIFTQMGGEDAIRALVKAFYDIVESDPAAKPLHDLHLGRFGMDHIRAAQFDFLCGFFGGPRYYVERHGHSNLRDIHAHLSFGEAEARIWLGCMARTLERSGVPEGVKPRIMAGFTTAARVLVEQSRQRELAASPARREETTPG
jgi:hemoglobin